MNGQLPDPLAGKRQDEAPGFKRGIEHDHVKRFWMIIGFIGMSWLLYFTEKWDFLSSKELAHGIVDFIARYGYIAFLIGMVATVARILWIEAKGIMHLRSIDEERLDMVEIAHPYLPKRSHIVATIILALTFPLFVAQVSAQAIALTMDTLPEPEYTVYEETRVWQIANDAEAPVIAAASTADNSTSITKPTGTAEGDLLVIVISAGPSVSTVGLPSGFTAIAGDDGQNKLGYKVADGSEPASYTISASGQDAVRSTMLRITGADTSAPIDVQATATSTTTSPAVTTTVENTLILLAAAANDDGMTTFFTTAPSGYTSHSRYISDPGEGEDGLAAFSYKTQSAAGSTGTAAWGGSSGTNSRVWTVAIAPPSAASKTWDGGGSTASCSEDANWSDDLQPESTDHVVFDDTSVENVTWDASCPSTVASFSMNAGYTGTGTFAGTFEVTGAMTIGSGTLVTAQNASGAIKVGTDLTLGGDARIVIRYWKNTGGGSGQLIAVAGNMIVGTGAFISADLQGFAASAGPGVGVGSADGGSHGGVGGDYLDNGTNFYNTYGSYLAPMSLGSGGQGGGVGGGAIRFVVDGSTSMHGTVTANGGIGGNRGGAGGSVFLTTGTLAGSGTIRANGGSDGQLNGGGGRIAIILTSTNATFSGHSGTISAYGGNSVYDGAAGTVYKEEEADAAGAGKLIIDNANAAPLFGAVSTAIPSGQTWTVPQLILQNRGMIQVGSGETLALTDSGLSSDTDNRNDGIRLAGGTMTLSSGTLTVDEWTILADYATNITGNVTVASGGVITHTDNSTTETFRVNLTVTGDFNLQSGGAVTVDNLGYNAGNGPGKGVTLADGGSHGGVGGDYAADGTVLPNTYGSFSAPTTLGSGADTVASGGGAAQLTVTGLCTINGTISANGQIPGGNRAGAGGSVYITAGTFAGAGIIRANGGGDGATTQMGGGGGRVAIILTGVGASFSGYTGIITAYGGNGSTALYDGAAGTVYKQTTAQAGNRGQLLIANFAGASVATKVVTNLDGITARTGTAGLLSVSGATFRIGGDDFFNVIGTGTSIIVNTGSSILNGNRFTIGGTGATVRASGRMRSSGSLAITNYIGQSDDAEVTVGSGSYTHLGFNNAGTTFKFSSGRQTINVSGNLSLTGGTLAVTNAQTISLSGSWLNAGGTFSAGTGTVRFWKGTAGTKTINETSPLYNLTISGASTVELGANLDVNGSLLLSAGTLDVSSGNYNINVAGNWLKASAATFAKQSGTVTFDGSSHQTISGSTVFHALSATTSAARTLFFDYSGRQSASGSLTLRGVAGNRLSIRSTLAGSAAQIDLDVDASQLSTNVEYLDVQDSNAGSGQELTCLLLSEGCVSRGNNTNWLFGSYYSISGTAYSDEGTAPLAEGKRISVSLNGGPSAGSGLTTSGGFYSATLTGATLTGGTIISIYIDNETDDAVTVTLGSGSSMTGMHLYQNRLIVRSDSGSVAITNSHLNIANNNADTDITAIYNVDSNNILQVAADKELYVWAGDTYTPGARIKTHDLEILGSLSLGSHGLTVTGSLITDAGTMTTSTGITLGSTATSETLSLGSNSAQNLTINNGLVGYWKFDEGMGTVAKDSSSNGNNGTLTGGPTWSSSVPNTIKFQNAGSLEFQGASSRVVFNKAPTQQTTNVTLGVWAYVPTTSEKGTLIHVGGNSNGFGIGIGNTSLDNTGNNIVGFVPAIAWLPFGKAIGTGWHHLTLTRDATTWRGYVDGVVASSTFTSNPNAISDSMYFGVNYNEGRYWSHGIDDVRIYNRALSTSEVARLASGYQDTGSGTYTLGSSLDVNGNLNIVSGGISAGSNSLNLAGNLANYGGFTKGTSTVTFDGSGNQTISGSTVFNAISATTSAARTIFFDYSGRQSASGSLTLRGVSGNKLSLRSTRSGSGARVDLDTDVLQISTDFAQLDVKDSNAGSGQMLLCYSDQEGCTNSGNNANWLFVPAAGTGTVKGILWNDENGDGNRDGNENTGLASVSIELTGTTATGMILGRSTTTASTGLFFFSGSLLSNGTGYTVTVNANAAPTGYIRTRFNSSGSNILGTGGVIDVRFGYVAVNTLTGSVAAGATVFSGAELSLSGTTGTGGSLERTTVTNASGTYVFTDLPTSETTFLLVITPPTGYTTTTTNSRSVAFGTGGQVKIENFEYTLTPVSSSSSSSSTSAASDDDDSQGGGTRGTTITVTPTPASADDDDATDSPAPTDSDEEDAEVVRDLLKQMEERRLAREAQVSETQQQRVERAKEFATTWLIGGEETTLLQVSPIVTSIVSVPQMILGGIEAGWRGTAAIGNAAVATAGNAIQNTIAMIGAVQDTVSDASATLLIAAGDVVRSIGAYGETAADVATSVLVAVRDMSVMAGEQVVDVLDGARQIAMDVAVSTADTVSTLAVAAADAVSATAEYAGETVQYAVIAMIDTSATVAVRTGDALSELSHRTSENIRLAYEQLRRGVTPNEIAQLPPQRQYKTEIRREGQSILVAQLTLSIFDSLGLPLTQTPVVLFSTPKIATTNDEGVVTFHDVEVGQHHIEVHIDGGAEVLSQEIIIEPPANVSLDDLERIDAVLPVIQVVAASTSLHAAAPYQLVWLWLAIGVLGTANVGWFAAWVWSRRKRV